MGYTVLAMPCKKLVLQQILLRCAMYVGGYDGEILHNYALYRNDKALCVYRKCLDGLIAHAWLVLSGNDFYRAMSAGCRTGGFRNACSREYSVEAS